MIYAFVALAAIFLLTVLAFSRIALKASDRHGADVELLVKTLESQLEKERNERRQLADRLQRPEILPIIDPDKEPEPGPDPLEPDFGLIGTVVTEPESSE